jgi:hypothetical protein
MLRLIIFRSVGGYVSSRVYASLGGTDRRKNTFLTATALPTCVLPFPTASYAYREVQSRVCHRVPSKPLPHFCRIVRCRSLRHDAGYHPSMVRYLSAALGDRLLLWFEAWGLYISAMLSLLVLMCYVYRAYLIPFVSTKYPVRSHLYRPISNPAFVFFPFRLISCLLTLNDRL